VLLAIGLSVALLLGLWLLTDRTIRDTLDASAREAVDLDLAGLADIHASGGRDELVRRIDDRLAIIPVDGGTPHYLLSDDAGRRIAGDIAAWPPLDPAISEAGKIRLGEGTEAYARATRLAPDLRLVVAHETADAAPLLHRVALVFLAGGAVFVLVIGIFSRLSMDRLRRRITRINAAYREPDGGQLVALSSAEPRDEIDELAAHSASALARLSALMDAYRDASDQIAHEIRTPLMHLDGRLVKALATDPPPETAQRLLEARDEIRRLVSTLESLLDIAASKAHKGDRHGLKQLNLSAMVRRICELYQDSAEESGHAFTWRIAPGIRMEGEESQLGRLVTNLLDNAFKYVPEGGKVTLTLDPGPVLVVEDDGPGVPESERERIFERFYRSEGQRGNLTGSGLGLALARAIAERHRMTLVLDPAASGARFRLSGGAA
jgi:signal transduction histidine kinase